MDLYLEQYAAMLRVRRPQFASMFVAAYSTRNPVSRQGILSATRRLMSDDGFYDKTDFMLAHMLTTVRDLQPASRLKMIKALREIVRADPRTLSYRGVQQTLQMAMQDPSNAVRERTLDLLGTFLTARPEFVPHYYSIIAVALPIRAFPYQARDQDHPRGMLS